MMGRFGSGFLLLDRPSGRFAIIVFELISDGRFSACHTHSQSETHFSRSHLSFSRLHSQLRENSQHQPGVAVPRLCRFVPISGSRAEHVLYFLGFSEATQKVRSHDGDGKTHKHPAMESFSKKNTGVDNVKGNKIFLLVTARLDGHHMLLNTHTHTHRLTHSCTNIQTHKSLTHQCRMKKKKKERSFSTLFLSRIK